MQKIPKIRSEKHRRFIASLPCCVSGREDVQAAHIRLGTGGGTSLKPGDDWCIPLSCGEHANQHHVGERIYWGDRIDAIKTLAQFLYKHTGGRDICLAAITEFKRI